MARRLDAAGVPFLAMPALLEAFAFPAAILEQGRLTYLDRDHWSAWGAARFGPAVIAALGRAGHGALLPPERDRDAGTREARMTGATDPAADFP